MGSRAHVTAIKEADQQAGKRMPQPQRLMFPVVPKLRAHLKQGKQTPYIGQFRHRISFMSREYTNYQKQVIGRYYENRDQIDQQRLGELVTSLYLAAGKKQSDRLWNQAAEVMTRLKVPKSRVEHVLKRKDPAILAEVVQDLQKGVIGPDR